VHNLSGYGGGAPCRRRRIYRVQARAAQLCGQLRNLRAELEVVPPRAGQFLLLLEEVGVAARGFGQSRV